MSTTYHKRVIYADPVVQLPVVVDRKAVTILSPNRLVINRNKVLKLSVVAK